MLICVLDAYDVPDQPKPRPKLNLAQNYQQRGRRVEAAGIYEEIMLSDRAFLETVPLDNRGAYTGPHTYAGAATSNLSAIYLDIGNVEQGVKLLENLVEREPSPEAVTNLAVAYLRQRQPFKALLLMIRYEDWSDDFAAYCFNRGEVLTALNQCELANRWYDRAHILWIDLPRKLCKEVTHAEH